MTPWTQALIEELAGIQSAGKLFEQVVCCPRWPAAKTKVATATAHFPASNTYFTYRYQEHGDRITLLFTGTGRQVTFRVLLPGWQGCTEVSLGGESVAFEQEAIENSVYVSVDAEISGVRELTILR